MTCLPVLLEIIVMKRIILGFLAALSLSALQAALPEAAKADLVVPGEEHCVVNIPTTDTLNLRARPGIGSEVLTRLRYAQCGVMITAECRGNWCLVEDGHHAGWAHRRYLAMVSPSMYCVSGVEAWDKLNLRAYPSASSRILTRLGPNECDIAILPYATGNWVKVRADGWEGWVNRRYLSGQ